MRLNDATRFDWDRLREASAAGHSPQLELDKDGTQAESHYTAHGMSAPLLDKYIALADEEQRQQDLFVAQWDDYEVDEDEDVVNNPDHYNTGNIECIEAIEESMSSEAFKGYLKGNCMKYLWRYAYKNKPVEDLQKAGWYLHKLTSIVNKDNS